MECCVNPFTGFETLFLSLWVHFSLGEKNSFKYLVRLQLGQTRNIPGVVQQPLGWMQEASSGGCKRYYPPKILKNPSIPLGVGNSWSNPSHKCAMCISVQPSIWGRSCDDCQSKLSGHKEDNSFPLERKYQPLIGTHKKIHKLKM